MQVELINDDGGEIANALTALCRKIWANKQQTLEWTQGLVIPRPRKGNVRLVRINEQSLISYQGDVESALAVGATDQQDLEI